MTLRLHRTYGLLVAIAAAGQGDPRASSRPAFPRILGLEPDPLCEPREPAEPPARVAACGLFIGMREGSAGAPQVTRDREGARTLAAALAVQARAKGTDFVQLVAERSDDPGTRSRRGFLGTFRSLRDATPVGQWAFRTRVGGVVGPVETGQGFWLVKRVPLEAIAFDEIVFAWAGLPGAAPGALDKDATARVAQEWVQKASARGPEFFEELAAREAKADVKYDRPPGAVAPVFRGELIDAVEEALLEMQPGGIAGPIETPKGFVVVRRSSVEWVTFDSILVPFAGAEGAPLTTVRTKGEARERAEAIAGELQRSSESFAAVAARWADDEEGRRVRPRRTIPVARGSYGWLRKVASLAVGERAIVESPFGVHVVQRVATEVE